MNILLYPLLFMLGIGLIFTCPTQVHADGGGGSRIQTSDPAFEQAIIAIQDKDWNKAVGLLKKTIARDKTDANAHNLLGYAERQLGNLDAAFVHYERALALDPKHRGAHEYVGEAYLMVDNLSKAEEHLAMLDKLCFFSCEEYSDLKEAIVAYKKSH